LTDARPLRALAWLSAVAAAVAHSGARADVTFPELPLVARAADAPRADRLAAWHELLGSEPHVAGTEADERTIQRIRDAFVAMRLRTVVEDFVSPLPQPKSALVEIVDTADAVPAAPPPAGGRRGVIGLPVTERNLAEDPATAHPGLTFGWNAYSASGDVTAGVVYANYGTKSDFERLRALGVDCTGKIVLARYGGNFRGFKAKFAEEAGAAALLIYTDPADSGPVKGPVWPEGGWANETCIQRGSVLADDQPGDPTTPMRPSVDGAARRALEGTGIPRIPVQPIGYAAATEIMRRMTGAEVPKDAGWSGGIPFPYRLEGGDALRVRVKVEQDRELRSTSNVIGLIPGRVHPDQWVIVGCHHDAWGFGAADPLAGTIVLLECARVFAEASRAGLAPDRTIVFAAWGAEEYGIIGSTEWCEAHRERLARSGVAYVNLDMASMGLSASASASPSIRDAFIRASVRVPQPGGAAGETVHDRMCAGGRTSPAVGDLGGGSDHVGFVCHLGITSIAIGAGGAPGTSYHSNYDTLAWYRSTVGADYASALMVSRLTCAIVAELSAAPVVPLSCARHGSEAARLLESVRARTADASVAASIDALGRRAMALESAGARVDEAIVSAAPVLGAAARAQLDAALLDLDRAWIDPAGLDGRPWFRSLFCATDRDNGYAPKMLPLLSEATESGDRGRAEEALRRMGRALDRLDAAIRRAAEVLAQAADGGTLGGTAGS
jgi:N-acetylated-alpha-linked acidic dipeptidase